jgi:hypothetical protein
MQAMLDTRALELINAEIDGELAADDRAELSALLAASAEARALQADLQKLSNLIDGIPEQEPPADLSGRILGQIRQRDRGPSRPTFSLAGLLSSLQPIPIGAAFAAGLLLTVGVYEMSPRQWADTGVDGMVGTIMLGSQGELSGQDSRLAIAGPGVLGAVSLSGVGDILVLSFDVAAERETEIVIAMADAGLGFSGIAHKSVDDAANGGSYEVSGGNLRVVSQASHPFNVFLRRVEIGKTHPQGIGIKVIYSGERVFEGLLEFAGERG